MKKKYSNKIVAFLSAVLVAVSIVTPVYASGVDTVKGLARVYDVQLPMYDWGFPSGYDEEAYPYWVVFNGASGTGSDNYTNKMLFYCSSEPIYINVSTSGSSADNLVRYGSYGSTKMWISGTGLGWSSLSVGSPNIVYINDDGTFSNKYDWSYYVESNHNIKFRDTEIIVYKTAVNEVFNKELGYVQKVDVRELYIDKENGSADPTTGLYQIRFDEYSTTGADLKGNEYYIRVYGQFAVYQQPTVFNNGQMWQKVTPDDLGLVEVSASTSKSPMRVEFVAEELRKEVEDALPSGVYEEYYSFYDMQINGHLRRDTIYLQIVKIAENGLEYGGLTKIECTGLINSFENEYSVGTVNPDLSIDGSGYQGDKVEGNVGHGSSYGDATGDIDEELKNNSASIDGAEELLGALGGLLDTVGAFPKVVAQIFSFLPSWCLVLVGSGFGVLVFIIILKFIRG